MSIEDRLDEDDNAPSWKSNAGDKLVGECVEIKEWSNRWGPYPIVVIEKADGSRYALHGATTVLKNSINSAIDRGDLVARTSQHPGSQCAAKDLGDAKTKDGTSFRNGKFIAERPMELASQRASGPVVGSDDDDEGLI